MSRRKCPGRSRRPAGGRLFPSLVSIAVCFSHYSSRSLYNARCYNRWSALANGEIYAIEPHPADVVELVDTPDLGSGGASCGGSSPFVRTTLRLRLCVAQPREAVPGIARKAAQQAGNWVRFRFDQSAGFNQYGKDGLYFLIIFADIWKSAEMAVNLGEHGAHFLFGHRAFYNHN